MIGQLAAAAVGSVAFALLFGVPRKYYPYCAAIGAVGWGIYCALVQVISPALATFAATVAVILLSRFCAIKERCPVTIFLISGIIPLVPGAGIYWTAYYIVTNELGLAVQNGFTAVKAAMAIVLGIVCVFEIPQKVFLVLLRRSKGN